MLVSGGGDRDAALVGELLQPIRDVDSVARGVVTLDDHVAEVDADTELELAIR